MRTSLIRKPYWNAMDRPLGLSHLFEDIFSDMEGRYAAPNQTAEDFWAPAIDIREDKEVLSIHADVPGIDPENLSLQVEDGVLTLEGNREVETCGKDEKSHWTERRTGTFRRSVKLPSHVDGENIKAAYNKGVLSITCPLKTEAKPRQIKVEAQ